MSDGPGLLRDSTNPDSGISHLKTSEVAYLKQGGIVDQDMIPMVDSAVATINPGVEEVPFADSNKYPIPCCRRFSPTKASARK